ncbi:whey acidic protein-like [Mercenaria mercenaria]|uniref:whey acidic protein-like n=1 Tax=Mercenaria mercenaria TaxID=6596 RepID=UPI00234F9DF8|nr:whey acidic protein-like [Mercenaria mercenaria]
MSPVSGGRSCFYKGEMRMDGETFKERCNECTCNDGHVSCTEKACGSKPGRCPRPTGIAICVKTCTDDSSCHGRRKCCSNGCGHTCVLPENGGNHCYHKGQKRMDGETFKDRCNTCTCNNGHISCTEMACGSKPGRCPRPTGIGICVELCTDDSSCHGRRKCCSNGCGHTCERPVGICDGMACPQVLRCPNQYTPPGQCCPVCGPIGKPDCSKIACTLRHCVGQYTPPGQCCPVCPRNTY